VSIYTIERRQTIGKPVEQVFSFFADVENLDRITPPWMHFRVHTPAPIVMCAGARIEYTIRWRGLSMRWLTEIEEWLPGKRFIDRQVRGPYRLWHHTHSFEGAGDKTIMADVVRYALPWGPIGRIAHAVLVRRDLKRIFDFRAERIQELV
jgi:ligand-binding SRPBCC domain-containing protein